jgi:hypothetical protein
MVPWRCALKRKAPRWSDAADKRCPPNSNHKRAVGRIRRYVRANRLRFLWTLTFEGPAPTPPEARAAVQLVMRGIRETWGRLPLVAVVERGEAVGRLHVHLAAPRFLSIERVRALWHRGFVWVGDDDHRGGRTPPRRLAAYMSKYLAKQLDQDAAEGGPWRAAGQHRYFCSQGFEPLCLRRRFGSQGQAASWLLAYYGIPDAVCHWGDRDEDLIYGVWLSYPDDAIERWHGWPVGNSGRAMP